MPAAGTNLAVESGHFGTFGGKSKTTEANEATETHRKSLSLSSILPRNSLVFHFFFNAFLRDTPRKLWCAVKFHDNEETKRICGKIIPHPAGTAVACDQALAA